MCGNGMRCFVKWLASMGFHDEFYHIETMESLLIATLIDQDVCIDMGSPRHIQWDISLRFNNQFLSLHSLNTGVPHAILFTDHIENVNFKELGSYIRHYSLWSPQGTNVTLVQKQKEKHLKIRTYERGVEGETLACGTGAVAAALAAARQHQMSSPIYVENQLGEKLKIDFCCENQQFSQVTLTGSAKCVFTGDIHLDFDCF